MHKISQEKLKAFRRLVRREADLLLQGDETPSLEAVTAARDRIATDIGWLDDISYGFGLTEETLPVFRLMGPKSEMAIRRAGQQAQEAAKKAGDKDAKERPIAFMWRAMNEIAADPVRREKAFKDFEASLEPEDVRLKKLLNRADERGRE